MKWQHYIVSDKKVLLGKPVIKGTRISVEHLIDLLAQGWTEKEILENYPRLNDNSMKAVFLYIRECLKDGLLYTPVPKSS
jgi:uncharacterized protein (DUF433 family)